MGGQGVPPTPGFDSGGEPPLFGVSVSNELEKEGREKVLGLTKGLNYASC